MTPLLDRNEQFARTYTPVALGLPAVQMVIVTCLDHRVDPAIVLGLRLGDAPVIRNAGGRVTQAVIDDLAGLPEAALEASAVADPHTTVKADVERLLASPLLAPKVSVSGHVYDTATGRVTTTLDARYPSGTASTTGQRT
jgi:carbonic anhydrase